MSIEKKNIIWGQKREELIPVLQNIPSFRKTFLFGGVLDRQQGIPLKQREPKFLLHDSPGATTSDRIATSLVASVWTRSCQEAYLEKRT